MSLIDGLFAKLIGRGGKGVSLAGLFLTRAIVEAWSCGHSETDVEHVLVGLVDLVDVKPLLARRGILAADVDAIVEQLLAERPVAEELGPEPQPSARLKTVCERSVVGDRIALAPFFENLAAALPRELAFARKAISGSAPDIAAFFAAPMASTPDGHLTFSAWSPQLATVAGLMQKLSTEKFKGWTMGLHAFFFALLGNKWVGEALKARGVNPIEILKETGAAIIAARQRKTNFHAPEGYLPAISPALYALFIRAERYAGDDRAPVALRHVLTAFHDEPEYAAAVEKLAG